jgi:regulator of ribonuclease activity A
MTFSTADLCDAHGDAVRVLEAPLSDFGAHPAFSGAVTTLRAFQDNSLVRSILSEPGAGRVLVVDAGGSLKCAMLGDQLAALAVANGWAGIVVFGCVRDAAALAGMPIGIKALGTSPRRTDKRGQGLRDVPLAIGGIDIRPGDLLYADADGVIVASHPLAATN